MLYHTLIIRYYGSDTFQEAKKYQLNVLDASRRSSVAIG